jgi:serine/threonine protein kinase
MLDLMNNELDVLRETDHPHIVRIFELLYDELNFYIVSELMTGGEFYGKIVEMGKFSSTDTASLVR